MSVETNDTPAAAPETQPAGGAAPANTPTPSPAQPDNDAVDPDEAELQQALADVEAEGKAAAAAASEAENAPTDPAAPASPAQSAAPAEPAPAAPAPTMVPVAVVTEERDKRQEAEKLARSSVAAAAYWKGVAEGRYPDPGIKKPAEPTPDDRIADLRAQQKALSAKVDEGVLSTAEYEEQRTALEDQIYEIRESKILNQVKATQPKQSDLYLDQLTQTIETQNATWLPNVPDDEIQAMVPLAKKDLAAAGFDIDANAGTAMGDYKLREAVVARLKTFGYDTRYGKTDPAPGAEPANKLNTKPSKEQLDEKRKLAAAAPPTPSGINAPVNSWTPDRVEEMDSLDLENMSRAQLRALGDEIDRQTNAHRVSTGARKA